MQDEFDKNKTIENDVEELLSSADTLICNTISKINDGLIALYWNIGKLVNDYKKKNNSSYGDRVIEKFSDELSIRHGKGFSKRSIRRMSQFNKIFENTTARSQSNKAINWPPVAKSQNITWSHIIELMKFNDIEIVNFYLNETENKKLSKRELISAIKSKSFEMFLILWEKSVTQ